MLKNLKLNFILLFTAGFLAASLISCATAESNLTRPVKGNKVATPQTKENESENTYKIKQLLENGLKYLDEGSISDGIRQLVAVLAEGARISNPDDDIKSLLNEAETTLAKIGASITMEASNEWLDENKNQISSHTINIGTKKALQPSIILIYNMGNAGKTIIQGAPVFFNFVKGSGLLTSFVNTNDYGQANCSIARIDNKNTENIIRAQLIYKIKGYIYKFAHVKQDFVFTPPTRKATILVLEKSKNGISNNPVILDSVYNSLKGVAFNFSQYNGVLLKGKFMQVFGGDPKAIKEMGLKKDVSYIVIALNDCYYTAQIILNGKKYNIFKSRTNSTTRIIRVSDGKVMYSASVQGVSGQGGNTEKSILDSLRKSSRAMADKLKKDLPEIKSALYGKEGAK